MTKKLYCGEVTDELIDQEVTINGWVHKRRDLGGMIFVDLRDRVGVVQVVFDAEKNKESLQTAEDIRKEFVIEVTGKVVKRQPGAENDDLKTGQIEIEATAVNILSKSKNIPFEINDDRSVSEELRLKYRYLDLRRPKMNHNLKIRHQVKKVFRNYLDEHGFIDVETPFLTKSTPEGARDYLVPSRVHNGKFFALPQSPQLFKQLLMSSGVDRYYQIVRCFRDEDLRGDRQPEFTQVDIETSFLNDQEIQDLIEKLLKRLVKEVKGLEITEDFPRLSYQEAMDRFGSDKPDIRFGLELQDVGDIVKDSSFKVFTSVLEKGGAVKGINAKGGADTFTRKQIDKLQDV